MNKKLKVVTKKHRIKKRKAKGKLKLEKAKQEEKK